MSQILVPRPRTIAQELDDRDYIVAYFRQLGLDLEPTEQEVAREEEYSLLPDGSPR